MDEKQSRKKVMPVSPGRPKGVPNKVNGLIKDMIVQALDNAGGVDYLTEQARLNPGPFMTLLGKVLPTQVTGEDGGPVKISVEWKPGE
jgi:hypothetical protein